MIKVEIAGIKQSYPKLMVAEDGIIVLFTVPGTGMCVYAKGINYEVGYYSDTWNMQNFSDYLGSITLENET